MEILDDFMSLNDKFTMQIVCTELKNKYRKFVKAYKIYKLWYLKNTEKWMDNILYEAHQFHSFTNRFQITPEPPQKGWSWFSKRYTLTDYPKCYCGDHISQAVYYSVGHRMKTSYPVLEFTCFDCIDHIFFEVDDFFYQNPHIVSYPKTFSDTYSVFQYIT